MSKKTFYTILLCGLAVAAWGQVELRYQAPLNFWAYNGLTRVGFDSLELGGPLVKNTEINATAAGYNLTITGSHTQNAAILTVSNTNASAIQNTLRVTAAGAGTYALEAAGNVFGALATGSVVGWDGFSSGGVGLRGRTTNSTGNSALDALRISRQTTGTPASGLGVNIDMSAQISSGSQFSAVRQRALWTDANSTSATARYEIDITDSLVQARKLALEADGRLILDGYSTNRHIGTGWAKAVFGADGTIYADTTTSSATVSGSGTAGTIPVWTSSTALGDSPLTVSGTDVTATGTSAFRVPVGTTAQQPGTPVAGMTRYNTTNGALEYRGVSAWEVPVKSASTTGLGTSGHVLFNDANGRATGSANLFWDISNNRLGLGTTSPATTLDVNGGSTLRGATSITSGNLTISSGQLFVTRTTYGYFSISSGALGSIRTTTGATAEGGYNHTKFFTSTNGSDRIINGFAFAGTTASSTYYGPSSPIGFYSSYTISSPQRMIFEGINIQTVRKDTARHAFYTNFYSTGANATRDLPELIRDSILTIHSDGKIGINTSSPTETVHISGTTRVTGSSTLPSVTVAGRDSLGVFTELPITHRGSASDTTDGSGDLTISQAMPDATFVVTVAVTGTTPYIATVHDKSTSGFKIRFFDTTGAAVTSTAVTADWTATDN